MFELRWIGNSTARDAINLQIVPAPFDCDRVTSEFSTKSVSDYFRWAIIGDLMVFGGGSVLCLLFSVSRLVDNRIDIWHQKGHPKWSPT